MWKQRHKNIAPPSFPRARRLNDITVSTWWTVLTYQTLVDDAEHERVVQKEVRWVFRTEADVGDGRVPRQPQRVQSLFLQLPTPLCVFFLQQRVLKDLQHTHTTGNTPVEQYHL